MFFKKHYVIFLIVLFCLPANLLLAEQKPQIHARKLTPRSDLFIMEKRLFDMINSERQTKGLIPFKFDSGIQKASRAHSRDMVKRKFFDHINPDKEGVGTRLRAVNIKWAMVAENIASNRNMEDPVEAAFKSWLDSSSHRRNIMNPEYELSGIGIAQAEDDSFFFTQIFVKK